MISQQSAKKRGTIPTQQQPEAAKGSATPTPVKPPAAQEAGPVDELPFMAPSSKKSRHELLVPIDLKSPDLQFKPRSVYVPLVGLPLPGDVLEFSLLELDPERWQPVLGAVQQREVVSVSGDSIAFGGEPACCELLAALQNVCICSGPSLTRCKAAAAATGSDPAPSSSAARALVPAQADTILQASEAPSLASQAAPSKGGWTKAASTCS